MKDSKTASLYCRSLQEQEGFLTYSPDTISILQGPKYLPISFWGPFEVPYTIIIQGIWNHNIGNYLGPYITLNPKP